MIEVDVRDRRTGTIAGLQLGKRFGVQAIAVNREGKVEVGLHGDEDHHVKAFALHQDHPLPAPRSITPGAFQHVARKVRVAVVLDGDSHPRKAIG